MNEQPKVWATSNPRQQYRVRFKMGPVRLSFTVWAASFGDAGILARQALQAAWEAEFPHDSAEASVLHDRWTVETVEAVN